MKLDLGDAHLMCGHELKGRLEFLHKKITRSCERRAIKINLSKNTRQPLVVLKRKKKMLLYMSMCVCE